MNIKELRILSSIPTNSVNNSRQLPLSMGSGCFVKYNKYTIFLTVYHTVDNDKLTTGIVSDFDSNKGVKLLPLNLIPPIISGNVKLNTTEIVDFAYQKMLTMPQCYFFDVDELGNVKFKVSRIELVSNLTDMPTVAENYGFAGYIYGNPTLNPNVGTKFENIWNQELGYYEGLKYRESIGDFHIFVLPNNDYEYDDFRGTSGTPILDSKGTLVALVSSGYLSSDKTEWFIKGINLSKYKFILDVACDLIK